MNIILAVAAIVFSVLTAVTYWKAGTFKAKASEETLIGAGMAWVKGHIGLTRVIAWLEILGAIGIIAGPVGAWVTNFEWSKWIGVAAAGGLTLTMIVGFLMHAVRGEAKYTWKMNFKIIVIAAVATVLQAYVQLPLF
ncbi:MAG: DoxX family protein [Rhodoluna sp.]